MEIRLAYERGFLTQKSLNFVQEWALLYHVYLVGRMKAEEIDGWLERQTLNLKPERWVKLYRDRLMGLAGGPGEEEVQVTEDDLDELDAFMAQQEAEFNALINGKHQMNGGKAGGDFGGQAEPLQWGAWQ